MLNVLLAHSLLHFKGHKIFPYIKKMHYFVNQYSKTLQIPHNPVFFIPKRVLLCFLSWCGKVNFYKFCGGREICCRDFSLLSQRPTLGTHWHSVFLMRSHQRRVEDVTTLTSDHTFDVAQDTSGFLGCRRTLLVHIQFAIHWFLPDLFSKAVLNPFINKIVLVLGNIGSDLCNPPESRRIFGCKKSAL